MFKKANISQKYARISKMVGNESQGLTTWHSDAIVVVPTSMYISLVTVHINLTSSCYEHVRAAAGEAVKEWFGSDIEVQECCGTAELSQAEPGPRETGLVPQEKRDRVPFFEPSLRAQRVRYFVTLLIHLLIRVSLPLEMNKHFSRVFLHRIQKAVHNTIERTFPFVYI